MEKPENRPWEVLSSEYLAREPWFTVRRERLRLPDGRIVPSYYVFEYPAWVNVIAITRDGHFVMIDQYRHGLGEPNSENQAGDCWPPVASLRAAAQRERMEETVYRGGQGRELMTLSANPATQNNLTHTFLATGVERQGDQHLDPTEDLRVHLFTEEQVLELLRTDRIRQALMAAPLWRYFAETPEAGDRPRRLTEKMI